MPKRSAAAQLAQLLAACADHTDVAFSKDVTIQACHDADRLDLERVGITPDPVRLGSDAARARIG